jgi:uracil-DNA glycosylase
MAAQSHMKSALVGDAPLEIPAAGQTFDDLNSLYAALRSQEVPPSDAFSDAIVIGEGPPHAPLMLVGEQPGDQEDQIGRPFVGPAGQLLDECLERAGIDRSDTFMTNAVKRFKFVRRGKRRIHQTPTAGDIAHYRWWLAEEIRLVAPRAVIALGATAVHALTGRRQPLAPIRSKLLDWQDRALLVTVHPSFLLRIPDEERRKIERQRFVSDLRKAAAAVG